MNSTPPSHRVTTAHLRALYPFAYNPLLEGGRIYIGRDLLGGPFCFDPWELYERGVITGPNIVIVGQIGRGKSALVKSLIVRLRMIGRQAWVIDPKGEYAALAAACGVNSLRLEPGAGICLNPLDHGSTELPGGEIMRRQSVLLAAVLGSSLRRSLTPSERAAADAAIETVHRTSQVATLSLVLAAMLEPDAIAARSLGLSTQELATEGRAAALELRRLVHGDLAGMFDGPTTVRINLNSPLVVVDLSKLYASDALGILMTCVTGWLQAMALKRDKIKRLVVVDEAWAVLHDIATASWLQANFKLSRAFGTANVAVVHRLSDLRSSGDAGSRERSLAEGLVADAETKIIFAQSASEVDSTVNELGLSSTEADLLTRLPKGVALWKVGSRSFLVEHRLSRAERQLVDTDEAMRRVG